MDIILHVVHASSALLLIVFILLQQGKGAEAGASFGSGAAGTSFGSSEPMNFLTKATIFLSIVFMVTSLTLAWVARNDSGLNSSGLPALDKALEQQQNKAIIDPTTDNVSVPSVEGQSTPHTAGDSDVPTLSPSTSSSDAGAIKESEK